jgi:hypothetical protein
MLKGQTNIAVINHATFGESQLPSSLEMRQEQDEQCEIISAVDDL